MAAHIWPLLVASGALLVVALGWFAHFGDGMPARLAWFFVKTAAVGLLGSFVLERTRAR